jgi:hypothetical protein
MTKRKQDELHAASYAASTRHGTIMRTLMFVAFTLLLTPAGGLFLCMDEMFSAAADSERGPTIARTRAKILNIQQQLGDPNFRKAYRMNKKRFRNLVRILRPYIPTRRRLNRTPNGPISDALRVSITLRYLAGGSVYDISLSHGVAISTVYKIINQVVIAITKCPVLKIKFPTSHDEQEIIAGGFQSKSDVRFDCCVGAIDGLLIWTEKPSENECQRYGDLQSGTFFCGRKHKFGFNMQAICDSEGRFLEVWITSPASASDYITYITSPFYQNLKAPGFLKPGLALFGDNAYVTKRFMVSPFKSAVRGVRDDYNFFQSQLRIRIEMAFGMLTQRWGVLRKPLAASLGIQKQLRIAEACCRLHNFCLKKDEGGNVEPVVPLTDHDELNIQSEGGLVYGRYDDSLGLGDRRPSSLLDGGAHFDDVAIRDRRTRDPHAVTRSRMRAIVETSGKHRPTRSSRLRR